MKNKKLIIVLFFLLAILGVFSYFFFVRQDETSTLTLQEKKWIEKNKNAIIDLSITNNIPVFNYEGKGVFLDFVTELEEHTNLEFNKIANDNDKEYRFQVVDSVSSNDLVFYQDNYVLLSHVKEKYDKPSSLPIQTIGVVEDDMEKITSYLDQPSTLLYKAYPDYSSLFTALKDEMSGIQSIAVPKNLYLKEILENDLHVIYQMADCQKNYVLKMGKNKTLNKILRKYYDKWSGMQYEKSYTEHFSDNYFSFKNISEKEKSDFRSKRYVYGFVENSPFDITYAGKLMGFNKEYIDSFAKIANIEIKYQKYNNFKKLLSDFDESKLDFIFSYSVAEKYKVDTKKTVSNIKSEAVILSTLENTLDLHALVSLGSKEVVTLKNTKLEKQLKEKGIKVVSYSTLTELFQKIDNKSILALDKYTYDFYKQNELKDYRISYEYVVRPGYYYVIHDTKANTIFTDFFNFYISFTSGKAHMDQSMIHLMHTNHDFNFVLDILLYIFATMGVFYIVKSILGIFIRPKEDKKSVKREDKLKYIDRLTSLKNRNYLNDNIQHWDDSDVYPQTILIIDLNNIAYINDNYGHKEGDNVIASAANILIKNQIINSEIIRTDGNEFLVYLVGYEEKQVLAYKKKLNKEFKELEHGFGAAIGYSMIVDAIKTIDDAINEATLDMKTVKEESNN